MQYFDYGTDLDIETFLQESQEQQERHLEAELERIEQQLTERDEIFEKHGEDLESKLDWYLDRLKQAYKTMGDVEDLKEKVDEVHHLQMLNKEADNRIGTVMVSNHVAENSGDCREALELLLRAGRKAAQAGQSEVSIEIVESDV